MTQRPKLWTGGPVGGSMKTRRFSTIYLALLAILVAPANAPLFAQAFYGSVVGTVTDQSGASLRGANVSLTNAGTGERHQTQSGAGGDYQFLNLVPGMYRVEVEQSGFKKATRDSVEVTVSGSV